MVSGQSTIPFGDEPPYSGLSLHRGFAPNPKVFQRWIFEGVAFYLAQCIPEYWLNLLRKGSSSHAGQAASPYRNIQLRLLSENMKELEDQSSLSSRAQEGFGLSDGFTSAFTAAISAS